jgi:excisionase family DNA binding protein
MSQMLLRAEEAARALGIGRSKLYALVAAGELPVIRIGRSTRIPAAALERWVEERTISRAGNPVVGDSGGSLRSARG